MRKTLTVLAVIVLIVAIAIGVGQWLGNPSGPGPNPTGPDEGSGQAAEQPEWCPAIEVIAVPATGESSIDDDPAAPHFNPNALFIGLTGALSQEFAPEDVKVWTTPYPAQIRTPQMPQLMTYDESQAIGRDRTSQEMAGMNQECPLTNFVMMGYSQGAAIAGDLAEQIGAGNGPVPAERISGVALVGDPRRDPNQGQNPGVPLNGVGLELGLAPVKDIAAAIIPGATMRGSRAGFGVLNDRVQNICAPGDSFCDAPPAVPDLIARAGEMFAMAGAHASYGVSQDVIPGITPIAWIDDWTRDFINNALN